MPDFHDLIQEIASDCDWNTEAGEIGAESAMFTFTAESGSEQTLFLTLKGDKVELDIPSGAIFESEGDISHDVPKMLLKRNAGLDTAAWVLEEIDGQWCFSLMKKMGLDELEDIDKDEFGEIVSRMVEECDEFDRTWSEERKKDDF